MTYQSNFVPNVENTSLDEFDFIFGCTCNEDQTVCGIDGKECPITAQ